MQKNKMNAAISQELFSDIAEIIPSPRMFQKETFMLEMEVVRELANKICEVKNYHVRLQNKPSKSISFDQFLADSTRFC